MEPRLQRRIQRYGWDLAAVDYESLWQAQLASAQTGLLKSARLVPGERVLDVACGTGLIAFAAAEAVGPQGHVVGIDLADRMVDAARRRAVESEVSNATFARMDAEHLDLPDSSFDVALCAFGLMYMPDPEQAVCEMRRVLRPGGRLLVLEFSRVWKPLSPLYDLYSFKLLPWMGQKVANDADSYRYLAESIRMHPGQEELKAMMEQAGLSRVDYFNLSAGVVALHRG
ncbi:MAG: ubiquinone/menaquinone biosynthesis methyltransferase, partial [Burkholderiales bacterium]|nr:ubiquinone/menaquinone biosynthesis methyltransferase [Burkholderiales bacterium]